MSPKQLEFPFQITEEGSGFAVRFPTGTALSESNVEDFARGLLALTERKPNSHLQVDLGAVTMVTSVVLEKLVSLNGKVRAAGGRLTLSNPTPIVHQTFKVTRLDTILEIAV